jgi:Ca2+/Na+ antiporter
LNISIFILDKIMDIHSLMGRASTMMSGKRNDDSMSDRLNYRYTVAILVIFAIINMNRLYTDQIKCWVYIYNLYLIYDIC